MHAVEHDFFVLDLAVGFLQACFAQSQGLNLCPDQDNARLERFIYMIFVPRFAIAYRHVLWFLFLHHDGLLYHEAVTLSTRAASGSWELFLPKAR